MKIIEEKPIPLVKIKGILEERYNKGDVNLFQRKAYEHSKKFSKIDEKKAEELLEELKKFNEKINKKLRMEELVKIVEILPKDIEELRAILVQGRIDLKKEEAEEVLKIVKKYV